MINKPNLICISYLSIFILTSPSTYAGEMSAFCELYTGPGYYLTILDTRSSGNDPQFVAEVIDSRGNLQGRYSSLQILPPTTNGSEITYTYRNTNADGDHDFTLTGTFKNGIGTAYSIKGIYNEGRGKNKPIASDLECNTFNGKPTKLIQKVK